MIKCIIVDDEKYAREELENLLLETSRFEIQDRCPNAVEALKSIKKNHPDVVFLDIQMPMISGMELLSMIDNDMMPRIVFVTAFDEFALKAIEENAFDYLLKPIEKKRLEKCIKRLENDIKTATPVYQTPEIKKIPCTIGNRIKLIDPKEIEYVFSSLSGVSLLTVEDEFFTNVTLKTLEEKSALFRCHKQYLINPEQIDEIVMLENGTAEIITLSQKKVPVSRRHLKTLKEKLLT